MLNDDYSKEQTILHAAPIDISEIVGPVYIIPVSCVGIVTYHALRKRGIEVFGFCDNDPAKAGKSYDGCSVCSPEEAVKKNPEAAFVVASPFYRKEILGQLEKLGAKNILCAEQFMRKDIFTATLDDIDEIAARTLTNVLKPIDVAIKSSGLDFNIKNALFLVPPSINPVEDFKQWFDGIYEKYDVFATINILVGASSVPVNRILEMLLYLESHLKKPTKLIKLRFYFNDTSEQRLHDLEECLLEKGISPIYFNQENIKNFNFRTTDIPIIIEKEDAYSDAEDKYNCVFIHIPKNAGTSIIRMLSSKHTHHKRALSCKLYNPERFDRYFKFAIVRNPWDRLVSQYFYAHHMSDLHNWRPVENNMAETEKIVHHYETFRDYVLSLKNSTKPFRYEQYPWICDNDGNILVDYIGRFENLPETIRYIQEKIGLDPEISLPHKNASKHKHYTEYYDEEMIEIVREAAKRDIELFGYEFGKHPGPNIIINPREDFVPVNRISLSNQSIKGEDFVAK